MLCPHCHTDIAENGALFCPECGVSLTPPAPIPPKKPNRLLLAIMIAVIVVLFATAIVIVALFNPFDTNGKRTAADDEDEDITEQTDKTGTTLDPDLSATTTTIATSNTSSNTTATTSTTTTVSTTMPTTPPTTIPTLPPSAPYASASHISSVVSSSILDESALGFVHYAANATDGDLSTAWVEGVDGTGVNETITLFFDEDVLLSGFSINSGYQKSSEQYERNARPKSIRILLSDGSYQDYTLSDVCDVQTVSILPKTTSFLTIQILSVYEGSLFEDTAISEITVF